MTDDFTAYREAATLLHATELRATGSGASAEDIARVAAEFGDQIRSSFVTFMEEFGWGGAGDIEFLGAGAGVPAFLEITSVLASERSELHPPLASGLLPIQRDGGGNLYCLRSRAVGEPWDVVFWDHERGTRQLLEQVAPHFGAWMLEQVQSLG